MIELTVTIQSFMYASDSLTSVTPTLERRHDLAISIAEYRNCTRLTTSI